MEEIDAPAAIHPNLSLHWRQDGSQSSYEHDSGKKYSRSNAQRRPNRSCSLCMPVMSMMS
jgi:hypothetical protein